MFKVIFFFQKKIIIIKSHDTSPSTSSDNWQKFFDLSKMDWYFGNIDRKEVKLLLLYKY